MYVTLEEKLNIGKRIYTGEITSREAAIEYKLPDRVVRDAVNKYEESIGVRVKKQGKSVQNNVLSTERAAYENMSREELINELILAKANELRAKKGYEVKGVGANKEFIPLNNESSK